VVRDAIASVCQYRGWQLIAIHVRFDHVHVLVYLDREPDNAWRDFKAYATRRLRESGLDVYRRKRWSRSGDYVRLENRRAVQNAVRYVIEKQGEPMATYLADGY
jgi:REP element-mobilizing transposase RayT